MQVTTIINPVLSQLAQVLMDIDTQAYTTKSPLLGNSSIGSHVRHTIEMYQCMLEGYETGIINYEKRKRNITIECDNELAASILLEISEKLDMPNKTIALEGDFCNDEAELITITTNYFRELIYNLEHTIHHMALIRVGIQTLTYLSLPQNFGVAPSTIKHQQACAR